VQTVTFKPGSRAEFALLAVGKHHSASSTATGKDYPYAFRAVDSILTTNNSAPECVQVNQNNGYTGYLEQDGNTFKGSFTLDFTDEVYYLASTGNQSRRLAVYPYNKFSYDAQGSPSFRKPGDETNQATEGYDPCIDLVTATDGVAIQAIINTSASIMDVRINPVNEKKSTSQSFSFQVSNFHIGDSITLFDSGSIASQTSGTGSNYTLRVTAVDVPTTVTVNGVSQTEHHYQFQVVKQTA
jgi:hypothetical protein